MIRSATADGYLGLFSAADFHLTTGRCNDCSTIRQALWYFEDDLIAVPAAGLPVAGFTTGVGAMQDVAQWALGHHAGPAIDYPPLVWVGSPDVVRGARLVDNGRRIEAAGLAYPFAVTPKIPLNRSYYNDASTSFLATRTLTLRGEMRDGTFVARTIWPEDFRLDTVADAQRIDATRQALRALVRAEPGGGAASPFAAFPLWQRNPGSARAWQDKPVLAVMLNGAQGDDDEAHGGHFALVTGRVGASGAMGDWLANNFYTLDHYSEKGIIAAVVPLDNYLADLNSGQAWYRPSYLLVAVLNNDRTANLIQGALQRVYNQFYRHQLVYRHATMNCASISVDVLRALGWNVAARGPTSRFLAAVGLPWFAISERSVDKAEQHYDYLTEDRTRLFPAAAFEEIGADLLQFATGTQARPPTPLEAMLADDLEALIFVRVPQLPSSRVLGDYPIVSTREYMARLPSDPALMKVIPVPPRPFPDNLRDVDLRPAPGSRAGIAVAVWAVLSVVGIPWLIWRWWQRGRDDRARDVGNALPT